MSKHNDLIIDAHNATVMFTYTIQQDATSGDTYALKYEGDEIVAVSGPLNHREVQVIQEGLILIYELDDFEPIQGFFHDPEAITWQPPIHTFEDKWFKCRFCGHAVYERTTCHLCFYLLAEDHDAFRLIAEWMDTKNMEPHVAAYSVFRQREREATQ